MGKIEKTIVIFSFGWFIGVLMMIWLFEVMMPDYNKNFLTYQVKEIVECQVVIKDELNQPEERINNDN